MQLRAPEDRKYHLCEDLKQRFNLPEDWLKCCQGKGLLPSPISKSTGHCFPPFCPCLGYLIGPPLAIDQMINSWETAAPQHHFLLLFFFFFNSCFNGLKGALLSVYLKQHDSTYLLLIVLSVPKLHRCHSTKAACRCVFWGWGLEGVSCRQARHAVASSWSGRLEGRQIFSRMEGLHGRQRWEAILSAFPSPQRALLYCSLPPIHLLICF